jgi:SAM-dependent methyltransferase
MDVHQTSDAAHIKSEILRLAPWYFDIEVAHGLRTSLYLDAPRRPGTTKITVALNEDGEISSKEVFVPEENVEGQARMTLYDARRSFLETLGAMCPGGLDGRSVLDCACNGGAYLFWAREAGAGRCFGFDLREHWIEQARFLAAHREPGADDIEFAVSNVYDVPKLGLGKFDVVLFNGILYHLHDPISGLRIAADLAEEYLIVDTAARGGGSPESALAVTPQPVKRMSGGIYGLRWLPVGPGVLLDLLKWMGFAEVRCTWWRWSGPLRDRLEVVAGRREGSLAGLDSAHREPEARICAIVSTTVPPNTDVLVASAGNDALLSFSGRRGWHFPLNADGTYAAGMAGDADLVMESLETLREAGARYLVVPVGLPSGLESAPDTMARLAERYPLAHREQGICRIYALEAERPGRFDPTAALARRSGGGYQR